METVNKVANRSTKDNKPVKVDKAVKETKVSKATQDNKPAKLDKAVKETKVNKLTLAHHSDHLVILIRLEA